MVLRNEQVPVWGPRAGEARQRGQSWKERATGSPGVAFSQSEARLLLSRVSSE